ncbi:PAS-domain containing protein [Mesorhizobium sp. WSM3224]|uniref:PAS-domain containing protein n=1 Tax=Mesorhizobium sp. WSM3224 TaxID=1040986 RepID=UPI000480FA93|nr:PAS-domain containing protein [Mesorhizobium sp. WSM3224]
MPFRQLFPRTAHLRVPGVHFADIIQASVKLGEEPADPGKTFDEHLAEKLAPLCEGGEKLIELGDGRIFSSRTKLLPNGCILGMMSDITERRSFEKNLEYQALSTLSQVCRTAPRSGSL